MRDLSSPTATLVPGLGLPARRRAAFPGEPSIVDHRTGHDAGPQPHDQRADRCRSPAATTRICASIVDATAPSDVAYAGPDLASAGADLHLEDSTIIGKVRTRTITLASNTIFHVPPRPPGPLAGGHLGQPQAVGLRPVLRAPVRLDHTSPLQLPAAGRGLGSRARAAVRHAALRRSRLRAAERRLPDGDLDRRRQRLPDRRLPADPGDRGRGQRRSCARPSTSPPSSRAGSSSIHRGRSPGRRRAGRLRLRLRRLRPGARRRGYPESARD